MAFNPNASQLDEQQIIQQVYDPNGNALNVNAKVIATISNIELIDPTNGNSLAINSDGSINTNIVLSPSSDAVKSWTQDGSGNPISSVAGSLDTFNASTGTATQNVPMYTTLIGAEDQTGKLQNLQVDPSGKLLVDITGTSTVTGTVNASIEGLTSFQTSQYTIGTSAVQITPTPLTNRSSMSLKAKTTSSLDIIYIGNNSSVTSSNGYALFAGDSLQLDLTPAQLIYAIGTSSSQLMYVIEIA